MPQLLDDLANGRKDSVRVAAVRGLQDRHEPAAIQGLIAALDDPSPPVRNQAIAALKAKNDARANDALFALTQDTSQGRALRIAAASALAQHHDTRALPLLIESLTLRNAAANTAESALKELGSAAVQPLVDALRDSETREEASRILASFGSGAVDSLVRLLGDNYHKYARLAAAKTLSEIPDARAAKALDEFISTGDPQSTAAAYRFLIRRGRPESENQLIASLNDYGDLTMAEDFASSGNARLRAAAEAWATNRGVPLIERTSDLPLVHWATDRQGG